MRHHEDLLNHVVPLRTLDPETCQKIGYEGCVSTKELAGIEPGLSACHFGHFAFGVLGVVHVDAAARLHEIVHRSSPITPYTGNRER